MKIFKLNPNGELLLQTENIKIISEFNALFKRNLFKSDIENLEYAQKEFGLIWYMYDNDAPCKTLGLTEKESLKKGIDLFKLPQDYKIDKIFIEAVKVYIDYFNVKSAASTLLYNILKGLNLSSQYTEKINNKIEKLIEDIDKIAITENLDDETTKNNLNLLTSIKNLIDDLLSLSIKLPNTIKEVENLIKTVELEKERIKLSKGGKEIGRRANPNL